MSDKDYYAILGVPKTATKDEIKAAYRKLAKQWHPDLNKSPEAPKRFEEIQEAYDTLYDDGKRKRYDEFGSQPQGEQGQSGNGGGFGFGFGDGGFYQSGMSDDAFKDVFSTFFGGRMRKEDDGNVFADLTVPFLTAARGGNVRVRLLGGKEISLTVPEGIADGQQLRLRGEGRRTPSGAGDLFLTIHIAPDKTFQRTGDDVLVSVRTSVVDLALGTRLTVPTVDGDVDMTVPEGTQPGQTFRLRGKGIRNSLRGTQGDEYVKIEGIVPTNLDRAQKDALKRLKESLAGR